MGCFVVVVVPKKSHFQINKILLKCDSDCSRTESTIVYDWDISAQSSTSSCTFCLYWSFLGSHTCAFTPTHTQKAEVT